MEGILDYTIKQKQKQELEQIPKQESITIPIEHYNLLKDIDNYGHRLGARFLNTNITFVRQQTYWLAEFGIKSDFDKLTKYAQKMKNKAIFKRLGYLTGIFSLPLEKQLDKWHKNISAGYSLLDPTQSKTGRYDSYWNLRINIEKQQFTSWRTH